MFVDMTICVVYSAIVMSPTPPPVVPQGTLTGPQMEILDVLWDRGDEGATVAEIWGVLARRRRVARTTVLTVVRRLEMRGWLLRKDAPRGARYLPACPRSEAAQGLVSRFVDEFFGGSGSRLVMSLLGTRKVGPGEVARLRRALSEQSERKGS